MPTLNQALQRRFPERRALITGAASGLGLAMARQLAAGGWQLGLLDRDQAALDAAVEQLQPAATRVLAWAVDVTDSQALEQAIREFAEQAGGLDLCINNAGVAAGGMIDQTSVEDWRWVLEINVVAVATGCRVAAPIMRAQGDGAIVNIASAAGFAAAPGMSAYNASKAAVISLSETLAAELYGEGPSVTVAMPSFFQTNLLSSMRGPQTARDFADRMMTRSRYSAEQAASDILTAAAEGRLYLPLPSGLRRFWRMKRWFPNYFLRKLAGQAKPK